jgi:LacI family transcriptional regulator
LQGIRNAIEEIKKYGIEVEILLFDQNDIASFNALQENLNFNELHGLLIAPMFKQETLALISKCEENAIPYVLINSDLSQASPIGYFGPDLYQSGLVAANLIQYSSAPQESILIVNISKELYPEHHLYIKQEAFISYFKPHKKRQIHTLDIRSTESEVIKRELHRFFEHHKVRVIFVTNSRVSSVASYLKSKGLYEDILLIGFDYLEDNLQYLEENVIDFLICHKPIQQGYQALLSLFNYVKFGKKGVQKTFMPIDIISQYNYKYYDN